MAIIFLARRRMQARAIELARVSARRRLLRGFWRLAGGRSVAERFDAYALLFL
jgi:hypothetical protein